MCRRASFKLWVRYNTIEFSRHSIISWLFIQLFQSTISTIQPNYERRLLDIKGMLRPTLDYRIMRTVIRFWELLLGFRWAKRIWRKNEKMAAVQSQFLLVVGNVQLCSVCGANKHCLICWRWNRLIWDYSMSVKHTKNKRLSWAFTYFWVVWNCFTISWKQKQQSICSLFAFLFKDNILGPCRRTKCIRFRKYASGLFAKHLRNELNNNLNVH